MTIYYLAPEYNQPFGGIKKIYRHVDILNGAGYSAYVLHTLKDFRCSWFPNQTKIAYWLPAAARDVEDKFFEAVAKNKEKIKVFQPGQTEAQGLASEDYLVIPEVYGPHIASVELGIKKVIFNQNAYFTFRGYPFELDEMESPYREENKDLAAVMTVSADSEKYLRAIFPHLKIYVLKHGSSDLDLLSHTVLKKNQICFMPRKNSEDARQVINILKFKGLLQDYELAAIDGKTNEETAQIMQESRIFLSFGQPEGCGLPPMEAMAAGCITIGYHGGGGRDFFKKKFSFPVEAGDIIGYARTVEQVLRKLGKNPRAYWKKTKAASDFIHKEFSAEKEAQDLISAWKEIIKLRGF